MIADMTSTPLTPEDWAAIDTVLLDLDGTLLDLHYDTHFWLEVVPAALGREARAVDARCTRSAGAALPRL